MKEYIGKSDSPFPDNLMLRSINIRAKRLDILGQRLTQARLEIYPKKNIYDIDITSSEVNGHILAPSVMTKSGVITATFQKINLNAQSNTQKNSGIELRSLPAIIFTANNVSYNNMQLGRVSFKTLSTGESVNIQTLNMISPYINLQAFGDWRRANQYDVSRLQGSATSNNVSKLLDSFGFDVHNFISSKGKFTFNLNWRGIPFSPELRSMNGTANIDLAPGRIIDVEQTSGTKMDIGKMLSIFSLQNIPRRLSFDFSDVFQKGYSFDSLKGNFSLKNGDAYTTNTRFEGSVASVAINGRIGLVRKDYDFVLSVTPYITSSVPVAATLITLNPLVGVAAFAVNKVVGTAVANVTTYYYSVTGPWSNPVFTLKK